MHTVERKIKPILAKSYKLYLGLDVSQCGGRLFIDLIFCPDSKHRCNYDTRPPRKKVPESEAWRVYSPGLRAAEYCGGRNYDLSVLRTLS